MSNYQDFFKKRQQVLKKSPKPKIVISIKSAILGVGVTCLAAGSIWFLWHDEDDLSRLMGKVDVTLFGEASAGEEANSAEASPKAEEKPAGETGKMNVATETKPTSYSDEEINLFSKLEAPAKIDIFLFKLFPYA